MHTPRRFRLAALCAASLALSATTAARAVQWQEFGPSPQLKGAGASSVSGRVSALAWSPDIDGQGTSAFFLGAAGGGVWRSTDYESATPTWTPLTDNLGLPPQVEVGAIDVGSIAVDPFHPNIIYVGTGEANFSGDSRHGAGILKSEDGGDTWTLLGYNVFGRQSISKIFVDPTDTTGNTLYCSMVYGVGSPNVSRGIFRSTDGGITWTRITGAIGSSPTVTDMEYTLDSANNITLYAGVSNSGVWRSTNRGTTWTRWTQTSTTGRVSLAADHTPGASPAVYAVTETSPGTNGPKVFVTRNSGASWTGVTDPGFFAGGKAGESSGQGWYDLAIALAPDGRVTLGGVSYPFNQGVKESVDGGSTWVTIDVGTNGIFPHTDHHAFLWVNGKLYNGNDGGICRFTPVPAYTQSFRPAIGTTLTGGAARLATADMNGDGLPDVVVTGDTSNRVTVLLGLGNGQFGIPLAYTVDAGPVGVAVGDVNGDTVPDVVTANKGANTVSILSGVGNGTLQPPTSVAVGTGPVAVAVADLNGDSRLDIVTANETGNSATILLQNEDGTFTASEQAAGFKPSDVKVADLNNDGVMDIVIANSSSADLSVLTGAADGTYSSVRYPTDLKPVSVAVADMNGDSLPDLVAAAQSGSWVDVFINNGAGFTTPVSKQTAGGPAGVAVAELTGDAYPDVATANATGTVSILPGNATGALGTREDVAAGTSPAWIGVADFNNDSHNDLVVVNAGTGVSVLLYGPTVNPGGGPGQWESLNTSGLGTIQIQGMSLHPSLSYIALEGSQDNGTARRVALPQWSSVSGGDGGIVRFDPKNGNYAYKVAPQGSFGSTQFFQYSPNGGVSWYGRTDTISGDTTFPLEHEEGAMSPWVVPTDSAFPFYPFFTVNPDDGQRLAIGSTKVYESKNRATNWTAISGVLAGGSQVSALAYAPGYPDTLYAGFNNGSLYRTTNGGVSWTRLSSSWSTSRVSGIVVDSADPDTAYVSISTTNLGRVWKTTNGGLNWANISGSGLPFIAAQSIMQDPRNRALYVGMDLGVWATQDDGKRWIRFGDGLPNAQVLDVQLTTTTNLLGAGTHGRGAWTIGIRPGDINGDGRLDTADASLALGIWGGLATATIEDVFRCNIIPDSPGIQLDDVVAILRAAGGL